MTEVNAGETCQPAKGQLVHRFDPILPGLELGETGQVAEKVLWYGLDFIVADIQLGNIKFTTAQLITF